MKQSRHSISMLLAKYKAVVRKMLSEKIIRPTTAGLTAALLISSMAISPAAIGISPAHAAAGDVYILGGGLTGVGKGRK